METLNPNAECPLAHHNAMKVGIGKTRTTEFSAKNVDDDDDIDLDVDSD